MNEEMVPGEGEITETDAAELEREMAGADPALSATPGADVAGEIEIESINIDGGMVMEH